MNSKTTSASVNAKKMTMTALLAALALIFSYIEVLIPFSPGIPGIKLGIANLVIIISLYYLGPKYAFSVNLVRILIAGLPFQRSVRRTLFTGRSTAELHSDDPSQKNRYILHHRCFHRRRCLPQYGAAAGSCIPHRQPEDIRLFPGTDILRDHQRSRDRYHLVSDTETPA